MIYLSIILGLYFFGVLIACMFTKDDPSPETTLNEQIFFFMENK